MVQSGTMHKYRLLGRGKYTDVYLDKEHLHVIKEAKNKALQSERQIENEYQKLTELKPTNLAPKVYQLQKDEDGILSLVMDYIEGQTLREILDECEGLGEKLPANFALSMVNQLVQKVFVLHTDFKMAHFDLSPDNILISSKGRDVYFIDFSLARFEKEFELIGEAIGKLDYMAPETYEKEYGFYTDIYALGIILEEIITNAEEHAFFDKIAFCIASMKVPEASARVDIQEVYKSFDFVESKKTVSKKFLNPLLLIGIVIGLVITFFLSTSTDKKMTGPKKTERKLSRKAYKRPAKKIVRKSKSREPAIPKSEKYRINKEAKQLFKRIIK